MFKNIGGKIKTLATVITCAFIVLSIVVGVLLMANDMALVGVLLMLVGFLFAWVSSFVLYGYGQMIENSDKLVAIERMKLESTLDKLETKADKADELAKWNKAGFLTDEEFDKKIDELTEN